MIKKSNPKLNLLIVFTFIFVLYTPIIIKESYELQKSNKLDYPVNAVQYIKQHNEISDIMADYNCGGYLIFNNIPTMVDGRADLFTSAFNKTTILEDYIDLVELKTDYRKFFQKYGVKYVLMPRKSHLSYVLDFDIGIKSIYQDEKYKLYKL